MENVHLLDVTFLSLLFVWIFLQGVLSVSEFNSKLGLKSLLISDIKWQVDDCNIIYGRLSKTIKSQQTKCQMSTPSLVPALGPITISGVCH